MTSNCDNPDCLACKLHNLLAEIDEELGAQFAVHAVMTIISSHYEGSTDIEFVELTDDGIPRRNLH